MKILHISDTFGRHSELKNLPAADVLVHTGNFTAHGKRAEVYDFIAWLQQQPYKHKIFIAGDRDRWLYGNDPEILAENCHYLRYSAVIIGGVRFYGAPMFAEDTANGLFRKALDKIPSIPKVDVLLSHQQPAGIPDGPRRYCNESSDLKRTDERVKPFLHLFGHSCEDWGVYEYSRPTQLVNSAMSNGDARPLLPPHLLDLYELSLEEDRTMERIIQWGKKSMNVWVEFLEKIALWQLRHPETPKIINRTDRELLSLLPFGVNKNGTIRVDREGWLTPDNLIPAVGNPFVREYLQKRAEQGDKRCRRILDRYNTKQQLWLQEITDEICHRSKPFTALDINDVERITKDRKHIYAMQIPSTYKIYDKMLHGWLSNFDKEGLTLVGLLVYIDISAKDDFAQLREHFATLFEHMGLHDIADGVDVVTGIGENTEINTGQFRVTIIAAYE